MLHRSSINISGTVTNAKEALVNLERVDEKFYEIYASRAKDKKSHISEMAHKDTYFSPKQAMEANLIDGIV